jgi:hypothetical protein
MRQRFDSLGELNRNNRNKNNISLKFLIFIIVFVVGILYYASIPDNQKKITKNRTFEEMLEYRTNKIPTNKDNSSAAKFDEKSGLTFNSNEQFTVIDPPKNLPVFVDVSTENQNNDIGKLLNEVANYPIKSIEDLQRIINKFLVYKGYPENLVKVAASDINQSRANANNNQEMANFNFGSGKITVNSQQLNNTNNKEFIAILAHEFDHFNKLANLCKAIGINKFKEILGKNNINVDTTFWTNAANYANEKNFNASLYEDALTRLVTQNELEMTSSYSDFYKLAENIRNPLEVSAYAVSDSIYKFYGMPVSEGPTKRLAKVFNNVDNAVTSLAAKNNIPQAKVVLFDYLYSQAIIKNLPQFERDYQNCVTNRNGDLTSFWLAYEGSVNSFYSQNATTQSAYNKVYSLLEKTEAMAKAGISQAEILLAFKYKINTLKSNLVYPRAKDHLRSIIVSYLTYLKNNNITTDSEEELIAILTLICIDNNLTTENRDVEITLYYINLPEEIKNFYDITSKRNKFAFIYSNPAFKSKKGENILDEVFLIDMLNANRLDIRIKP